MRRIAEALFRLDRRVIFLIMGIVALSAFIWPELVSWLPPLVQTDAVRGVYNSIEGMKKGEILWISCDFDPGSEPELRPMATALIRHAFKKNLRVVVMGLWQPGVPLAEDILTSVVEEFEEMGKPKIYGEDYVFLGWQPGTVAVITDLGIDIFGRFKEDYYKNPTIGLKIFEDVKSMRDIGYMVCLAAGDPGVEAWIIYGADRYKYKMGAGCTAVIEPGLRPFLQTGQLTGLIGAMKGASEYEWMINQPEDGTKGINQLSLPQFLIGLLVILSAILYATVGRKR
jgi:hypothetical protein